MRPPRYSPKELADLEQTYPDGLDAAQAALPNRTREGIRNRAARLGLKVSPEKISELRRRALQMRAKKDEQEDAPSYFAGCASIFEAGSK